MAAVGAGNRRCGAGTSTKESQRVVGLPMIQTTPQTEGWSARLRLGFRTGAGKTLLALREREGPLAVQRPFYPEGETCHVYLLHPPGGVVGGDYLQIDTTLEEGSKALITTPGATKFYRSAASRAQQVQHLRVEDDASLEWLPQENIFFPGAEVGLHTRVDLQGGARLALWEIHCLGRPVIAELFDEGQVDSRLELWRDGEPLLLERLRIDAQSLQRIALLGGRPVTGTAVFSHAGESQLQDVRSEIGYETDGVIGATLIGDLLILRYLGDSTEQAKKLFTHIWSLVREPLLKRSASTPRIWKT